MPKNRNGVRGTKNRRKFNWRRAGRNALLVLTFCASASGVAWLLTTPRLAVLATQIQGNNIVPDEAVQRLAGCSIGCNILLIRTQKVREAVLSRPEIEEVKIRRRLPHTLIVQIKERKPFAIVTAGSGFYEIDEHGLIFRRISSPTPSVPLVSLQNEIGLRAGERPKDTHLASAMNCLALCNENDCRVTKLSVDHVGNVCLNMGSGFYVKLGQAEQIAEKLNIIQATVQARPDIVREALYIDVSCPSAPALKRKAQVEEPEV